MSFDEIFERVKKITKWKTQTDLAQGLHIKQGSVSGVKSRDSFPIEWAFKIAQEFNCSTDWLLTGEGPQHRYAQVTSAATTGNESYDMIPMAKAKLNAGGGNIVLSEEFKESYAFRKDWVSRISTSKNNIFLMMVEGNSMEPTIYDGDTVMIDKGRKDIRTGRIYALGTNDSIMIKRLELLPNSQVNIIPDNKNYKPYIMDGKELRIIGQVIWFARELVIKE